MNDTPRTDAAGLKPCPFCGSNNVRLVEIPTPISGAKVYFVECFNRSCAAGRHYATDSKAEAVNKWNARQLERELADRTKDIDTLLEEHQQHLLQLRALREGVEKLAAKSRNGWKVHADELLAMLK